MVWAAAIPAAISAAASIGGGLLGASSAKKQAKAQERLAQQQIAAQYDFAQHGIGWKVTDAQNAGIHPLYALGASTPSFSPVISGIGDDGGQNIGAGLAGAGQDIGRGVEAYLTRDQRHNARLQALQLERGELENQLLAAQLAKLQQPGSPPPFPDILGPTNRPYPPNAPVDVVRLGAAPGAEAAGIVKPKESEPISHGGDFRQEAGVHPENRWIATGNGRVTWAPGEALQIDELTSPGAFSWHMRNSLLPAVPYVGQSSIPLPPLRFKPKGSKGWIYNPVTGELAPVDRYMWWDPNFVPDGR